MEKIKKTTIAEASNCPFYIIDTKTLRKTCLLKHVLNFHKFVEVADVTTIDLEELKKNCKGEWNNCYFVPLLYIDENAVELDDEIEEYNPFEEIEEEEENVEENEIIAEEEKKNLQIDSSKIELARNIVKVQLVENPYKIQFDALVYPTNSNLTIDDYLLHTLSNGNIQKECDKLLYKHEIKIGEVYITSNGGQDSEVASKQIFHAVVASPTKLVNHDIANAIIKSIYLADLKKCQTIGILPADCGMMNIYDTALTQMQAIFNTVIKTELKYLKNIYVIMQDKESYQVFVNYYKRIFKVKNK